MSEGDTGEEGGWGGGAVCIWGGVGVCIKGGSKRMWIILLISSWGRYVGKGRECVHMLDKGAQYT